MFCKKNKSNVRLEKFLGQRLSKSTCGKVKNTNLTKTAPFVLEAYSAEEEPRLENSKFFASLISAFFRATGNMGNDASGVFPNLDRGAKGEEFGQLLHQLITTFHER